MEADSGRPQKRAGTKLKLVILTPENYIQYYNAFWAINLMSGLRKLPVALERFCCCKRSMNGCFG